jgi:flagellar capping protein FliD
MTSNRKNADEAIAARLEAIETLVARIPIELRDHIDLRMQQLEQQYDRIEQLLQQQYDRIEQLLQQLNDRVVVAQQQQQPAPQQRQQPRFVRWPPSCSEMVLQQFLVVCR